MQSPVNDPDYLNFMHSLQERSKEISPGNFRFYNIGRIPLLAKHTFMLSYSCPSCKNNKENLEELLGYLPDCFDDPGKVRDFERRKEEIEKHLIRAHRIRVANYHYSLYTLLGLIAGSIIGIAIQYVFQHRIWMLVAIAGTIAGAVYGKIVEQRKNEENKLM